MMRRMISHDDIRVLDPDSIETPAMVVFEHRVDVNIQDLCELFFPETLPKHVQNILKLDSVQRLPAIKDLENTNTQKTKKKHKKNRKTKKH